MGIEQDTKQKFRGAEAQARAVPQFHGFVDRLTIDDGAVAAKGLEHEPLMVGVAGEHRVPLRRIPRCIGIHGKTCLVTAAEVAHARSHGKQRSAIRASKHEQNPCGHFMTRAHGIVIRVRRINEPGRRFFQATGLAGGRNLHGGLRVRRSTAVRPVGRSGGFLLQGLGGPIVPANHARSERIFAGFSRSVLTSSEHAGCGRLGVCTHHSARHSRYARGVRCAHVRLPNPGGIGQETQESS